MTSEEIVGEPSECCTCCVVALVALLHLLQAPSHCNNEAVRQRSRICCNARTFFNGMTHITPPAYEGEATARSSIT